MFRLTILTILFLILMSLKCDSSPIENILNHPQPLVTKDNGNEFIVGGEDVTIENFPYMVSLQHYGSIRCGASIVTERKCLTAAHCIRGAITRWLTIRAGSTYHHQDGVIIQVDRTIEHEFYRIPYDWNNDIALVFLSESLVFGVTIQPITLPEQGYQIVAGSNGTVSGWGALFYGGWTSLNLQAVTIPVVDQELCASTFINIQPYPSVVTDVMFCAGLFDYGGKDACQGDSGGPFVINGVQQGVVSFGYDCALPERPGVYTRLSAYRNWIDNTNV